MSSTWRSQTNTVPSSSIFKTMSSSCLEKMYIYVHSYIGLEHRIQYIPGWETCLRPSAAAYLWSYLASGFWWEGRIREGIFINISFCTAFNDLPTLKDETYLGLFIFIYISFQRGKYWQIYKQIPAFFTSDFLYTWLQIFSTPPPTRFCCAVHLNLKNPPVRLPKPYSSQRLKTAVWMKVLGDWDRRQSDIKNHN